MHRFRYDGTGPARSFRARLPSSRIVSIGKSGGEGADGPGRRSFVEHGIAAVPLPYLGTSTIVTLLATGPGYLLARLIENGGDWNQTVAEIFGDALALPLWRSIPLLILSVWFNLYLLWLVRHSRPHIARLPAAAAPPPPAGQRGA